MHTVDLDRHPSRHAPRILDIGCGNGRHMAAAYAVTGARAVGVDIDFPDLRSARSRLHFHDNVGAHGGGSWSLAAADSLALPFPDARFDIVICSEVLEHIPDHHRALAEAVRVLVPGGLLAVSVPRRWPEAVCWRLSDSYANTAGGHIRIYRENRLLAMIREAGITPIDRHFAHALHTPYWWLKCLVGPGRDGCVPVRAYHHLLTWDMMKKPRFTRWLEKKLNPILGKSVVIYGRKPAP